GEAPVPHTLRKSPSCRFQTSRPSRSWQKSPPLPKNDHTCNPSVTQVDDACWFSSCVGPGSPLETTCCQRSEPSRRLRQSSSRWCPFSRVAVRKMRSPHTTGDDAPTPGSLVFQVKFLVDPHSVGRFTSGECPSPLGPRKRGQLEITRRGR